MIEDETETVPIGKHVILKITVLLALAITYLVLSFMLGWIPVGTVPVP
jgi:hypothetical protein